METNKKVKIGDYLLVIPMNKNRNNILWSHRDLEYKIFGKLNLATTVIGTSFDLYDSEIYSEEILKNLERDCIYIAMQKTYRYINEITKRFGNLCLLEYQAHNKVYNELKISPLNEDYEDKKTPSATLILKYKGLTKETIEESLISLCLCEKIEERIECIHS